MMDEKEIIREIYRKYWRCMIEKDADGLRKKDGNWKFTSFKASTY